MEHISKKKSPIYPKRNSIKEVHKAASSVITIMSNTESMNSDPILSWGSSVNVCEDLRRQIRSEIDVIDGDLSSLKNNLRSEESSSTQLEKDLKYARNEMINLVQGAAEELENAGVNEQIRLKMEESMKKEIVQNFVSLPNSPDLIKVTSSSETEMRKSENEPYNIFLSNVNEEKHKIKQQINQDIEALNDIRAKIQNTKQEYTNLRKTVESKNLTLAKHDAALEVQTRQRGIEKEMKKMKVVKEGIQLARKRCGDYAQQIVDQSKLLSDEKSKTSEYEEKLSSTIAKLKQEVEELDLKQLHSLETVKSNIVKEIDDLKQKLVEVDSIREARTQVQKNCEEVRAEIELLSKEEQISKEKVMNLNSKLKVTEEGLNAARDREKSLNVLKQENDDFFMKKVKPASLKQIELIKKKEKISGNITELHNEMHSDEGVHKEAMNERRAAIENVQVEVESIQNQLEENEFEINNVETKIKENTKNTEKELNEHELFLGKMKAAIEAEETLKANILNEGKKKRRKLLTDAKKKGSEEQKRLEYTLKLYEKASELVKCTNKKVEHLKNAPISLPDIDKVENNCNLDSTALLQNSFDLNENLFGPDQLRNCDHSCSTQQTNNTHKEY